MDSSADMRIWERCLLYCIPVPGLNSWAEASPEALIKRSMELASQQREKRQRGDDEAVDDMDLVVSNDGFEGSPSAKKMREDGHPSQSSQSQESVSQGACSSASVQPNVDRDSLPCLVKICDIPESDLKLNEVVEFIGVLTLVSQHQVDKDEYDDFENGFMGDELTPLPPRNEKEEQGFDHQEATMPSVPDPEKLLNLEELRDRRLTDPLLPRTYRNKVATSDFVPWPIEIRFCEPSNRTNQNKSPPSLRYWFRAKGKLSDDQALHRCVAAYTSDLIFLTVSLNPHRKSGLKTSSVSLDHSMWFHRNLKADDWILFVISSPSAYNARGFVLGQMFNRKGELVVSLTQEGLLREVRKPTSAIGSKL